MTRQNMKGRMVEWTEKKERKQERKREREREEKGKKNREEKENERMMKVIEMIECQNHW